MTESMQGRDVERNSEEEVRGLEGAPVTAVLLAINTAVFALQLWLAGSLRYALGGGAPQEHVRWNNILRMLGGNDSTFTIADTRLETLITSCFLHGSIVHLGFNMLVLWQIGPFLERAIGRARFLPLYLGSGIIASAFSAIAGRLYGPSLSIGASGAICGLIGAVLVLGARTQGWRGPLARQMAGWLAFLFVLGLAKNLQGGMVQVDNAAHIGGALGGALIATAWKRGVTYTERAQNAVLGGCIALVVAAGIAVYVRGATDPYLFMSFEDRLGAASRAARRGQCEEAVHSLQRAEQIDPGNQRLHDRAQEVNRACLAPIERAPLATPAKVQPQ